MFGFHFKFLIFNITFHFISYLKSSHCLFCVLNFFIAFGRNQLETFAGNYKEHADLINMKNDSQSTIICSYISCEEFRFN